MIVNGTRYKYKAVAEAEMEQVIFSAKKAGMLDAAISSRVELATKSMIQQISGDCINYSVLLVKYGDSCKALAENPGPRFSELLFKGQ